MKCYQPTALVLFWSPTPTHSTTINIYKCYEQDYVNKSEIMCKATAVVVGSAQILVRPVDVEEVNVNSTTQGMIT